MNIVTPNNPLIEKLNEFVNNIKEVGYPIFYLRKDYKITSLEELKLSHHMMIESTIAKSYSKVLKKEKQNEKYNTQKINKGIDK